jgi:hypothetical protein
MLFLGLTGVAKRKGEKQYILKPKLPLSGSVRVNPLFEAPVPETHSQRLIPLSGLLESSRYWALFFSRADLFRASTKLRAS